MIHDPQARAAARKKPKAPRSTLYRKLVDAANEIPAQPKTGWNDEERYFYTEAGPIVAVARRALLSRGILIIPRVIGTRTDAPPEKRVSRLTYLDMEYEVRDVEGGEAFHCRWTGQGIDATDKGANKALTSALKYFLIDLLLIPIGEDPEADTAVDREAKRRGKGFDRDDLIDNRTLPPRTDAEINAHLAKPAEVLSPPPFERSPMDLAREVFAFRCKRLGMEGRGSGTTRLKLASEILGRKVKRSDEMAIEDYRLVNEELFRRCAEKIVVGPIDPSLDAELAKNATEALEAAVAATNGDSYIMSSTTNVGEKETHGSGDVEAAEGTVPSDTELPA